jgi:two-component system cell cycle response regulator
MIGDRLRQEVCDNPFEVGLASGPIKISVSIGVATSEEGQSPGQLLEEADKALYAAKEGGRNQVIIAGAD